MKKLVIVFAILASIMGGCKSGDNKTGSDTRKNSESYLNYDDQLETKSITKVDTVEFRKVMNSILPSKRIIELFGGGYQMFYLGLTIEQDGKVSVTLAPDASWWLTPQANVERLLFKDNLEIAKDYAIVPSSGGDPKAISIKDIFYCFYTNVQKAFSASPGILHGKKVRTFKIFQIDITIDNSSNIIRPWTIEEVDIEKFRPHITSNLGREYYMGFFPSIMKEDFKFINQLIGFPPKAIARNVRGRVLIKFYFESNGKFAGYQLIKGLGYGCDEEVVNAIKSLKPSCYPAGQRSTVLVPFNFGPSDKTPVDVTLKSLEYDQTNPHNNLKMILVNKIKLTGSVKAKYSIHVFWDGDLILTDNNVGLNWDDEKGMIYWFGGNRIKVGEHDYIVSIDPENVLNDVDRNNNTIKGKLFVK